MRTVLLFLAALLTFCACSDDPEPTGQYLATIRLNELYGEKSIGEWQNDSVYPDGNMISEYMKLDADKQAKYVFQVKSRTDNGDNAIQKDGEWLTVYENTMAGTWSLGVDALLEPHFTINDTISNTSRLFIFTEVNDSVMIINTGYNTKLRKVTKP